MKLAATALAVLATVAFATAQAPPEADLLIRGGRIVDGTGSPWVRADVAITGDRIVSIGRAPVRARRTIDAAGKVIAPGFVDMHAHSEYGLLADPRGLSKITQGVTTEVLGEHISGGPVVGRAEDDPMMIADPIRRDWTTLGGFLGRLEAKGIGPNVLSYVGSGQVRACVIGYENRPATPAEVEAMQKLVAEAMEEGAFGVSSGLNYIPNIFASTEELIELAKVSASYGGIYVSHLRGGLDGLREGLRIARAAGTPLEIHHLNSTSSQRVKEFVAAIEEARRQGLDVTGNAYPYIAGWTYLRTLVPHWAQEGGPQAMVERLREPATRDRILAEMQRESAESPGRIDRTFVSSYNPEVDGLSMSELGKKRGVSPERAIVDLLIEQKGEGFQISFGNTEPNLAEALRQPWVSIGSDGSALNTGMKTTFGKPHPRSFGTHPRVLAKYVREARLFTLEEAVRKMTALPAARLGLADRGVLRAGMKADVVVFDPLTIADNATFKDPERYASGIDWVLVNGTAVVAEGKPTGALPGRVLRGPGYRP